MFKQFFFLGLICLAQASIITPEETIPKDVNTKAQDQKAGEQFVEEFYLNCGTIREDSCAAPRCPEVIKRCIGDREGCIESKDCYFAMAIEERANYGPFDYLNGTIEYVRTVQQHNVQLLDICHLKPKSSDGYLNEKLVAVGVGVFDDANKPYCEVPPPNADGLTVLPSLDDYRGFFFVSNYSECNVESGLPVHPADLVVEDLISGVYIPRVIDDPITNRFEYTASAWKDNCDKIVETMPANMAVTKQSQFLQYFTIGYYGTETPEYSSEGGFVMADNADVETKGTQLFLYPKAENRVITSPEVNSGILFTPSSAIITTTFIFSIVKSLF